MTVDSEHDEERDVEEQHPLVGAELGDRERGEHDRGAAAQPGPAQHQPLAQVEPRPEREQDRRRRAGDRGGDDRDRGPLGDDLDELGGEHEQPEREEQPELGDPRQALVERDDRAPRRGRRGAEHEPGEEHGEEARPVQGLGGPERERGGGDRGDRVQPGRRQRHTAQEEHRQGRDREADDAPIASSCTTSRQRVREPVVRLLDRLQAADDEQDRDRVVDARLALERAREPAPQRRPAQHREDRGRVGRRHRGAEQQRLRRVEVEQQRGRYGGERRGPERAERRQRDRAADHRADLVEARRRARPRRG